jgi:hypothetical protein
MGDRRQSTMAACNPLAAQVVTVVAAPPLLQ